MKTARRDVACAVSSRRTSVACWVAWYFAHVTTSAASSNAVAADHGWEERLTMRLPFALIVKTAVSLVAVLAMFVPIKMI